jgi:hypothetical protein
MNDTAGALLDSLNVAGLLFLSRLLPCCFAIATLLVPLAAKREYLHRLVVLSNFNFSGKNPYLTVINRN